MKKAIGRKRLEKIGLPKSVQRAITGENGGAMASILINIMVNGTFNRAEASRYRIARGPCTDRQYKAALRCLYGRHYSKDTLHELQTALLNPAAFTCEMRYKRAVTFVNVTPPERMAEINALSAMGGAEGIKKDNGEQFSAEELDEMGRNF